MNVSTAITKSSVCTPPAAEIGLQFSSVSRDLRAMLKIERTKIADTLTDLDRLPGGKRRLDAGVRVQAEHQILSLVEERRTLD